MLASYSLQFVAEKVETACALQASMDEGFHLFQGYHFGRPELMQRPRQESPRNHLLLGAYLCRAQADAGDLCHLIEDEPSLEHSLRGFSRGIGLAGDGSVVSLFARLGPEGRLHWGHHLLTAGLCDDRAA